jgi:hypothetical protein
MPYPAVVLSGYPGSLSKLITVPVIEDPKRPISDPVLKKTLKRFKTFRFRLSDAITAAERYVYIAGKPDNPLQFVEDWLNTVRWELMTFWKVDIPGNWYSVTDNPGLHFTSEHYNRSTELIGLGIAVKFLEIRLRISRARMRFIAGQDARPDVAIEAATSTGVIYALEARHRVDFSGLSQTDYDSLDDKKANVKVPTIAIYCCYGPPSAQGLIRTRLILADPPQGAVPPSLIQTTLIMVEHYLGVMSRIGIWKYHDRLKEWESLLQQNQLPAIERNRTDLRAWRRLILRRRRYNKITYWGRDFSSVAVSFQRGDITRQQAEAMFQQGDFGSLTFHGVHEAVLDMIETGDAEGLRNFFDDASDSDAEQPVITADGVVRHSIDVHGPTSADAKAIRKTVLGSQ